VCLGRYGEKFGAPEFEVLTEDEIITEIRVIRGASCGATWEAAKKLTGKKVRDAGKKMGLEIQFFCTADPSGFDPVSGRSPVHIAGELHEKAMKDALEKREKDK
jgi:thymidylate synthase